MTVRKAQDLYDAIYEAFKDYDKESERLREMLVQLLPDGRTLLDIGCGTGQHLARLRQHYLVEGLDLDPDMLRIAGQRLGPKVPLHQADMAVFDLGKRFDIVISLFSAIGYVRTVRKLNRAVASMAKHLEPGGVLLIEPWIAPEAWYEGTVHANFVNQPDLKIARMSVSGRRGRLSVNDLHYLVATPAGVSRLREKLVMGLFTDAEYRQAFTAAGLDVTYDAAGLMGRGLYLGRRK